MCFMVFVCVCLLAGGHPEYKLDSRINESESAAVAHRQGHLSLGGVATAYVSAITSHLVQLLYYQGSVLDLRRQPESLHHHIQSNGGLKRISKRKKILGCQQRLISLPLLPTCIIL